MGQGWVRHLLGRKLKTGACFPLHGASWMWGLVGQFAAPVPALPPWASGEATVPVRVCHQPSNADPSGELGANDWPPGKHSASPELWAWGMMLQLPAQPGPSGGPRAGPTRLVPDTDFPLQAHWLLSIPGMCTAQQQVSLFFLSLYPSYLCST